MPAAQWTITGVGLGAAMLGCCLMAVLAFEAGQRRWPVFAAAAAVFGVATVVFAVTVVPQVQVG